MFPNSTTDFVWLNWVPLKVSTFAMRATLSKIPSQVESAKRNVRLPSVVCAAWGQVKSTYHLLIKCKVA